MTVIEARGLRRDFTVTTKAGWMRRHTRVVTAVDAVDLTVERGEMLGYIGPNGAGKSTTLKMLTGVLSPSGGSLRVCGLEPVPQRRHLARQIGVVFGHRSHLWWDLPLAESFRLLRHVYGVREHDHRARLVHARRLLELDEFLHTPVRQLSLGQRMRGELTAALLHGPDVLFLDEPTIGLDIVSKQAVRAFLATLGAAGDTTMVLTTHDLADIERLSRRLIVINQGRIVHDGTLDELHARYGSRRRLVVDLDEPLPMPLALPGVTVESVQADGRRITYAIDGAVTTAGEILQRLTEVAALRDISMLEPAIEDVIARLYTRSQPSLRETGCDQI
jgi:ABC-2 type transport system ATP-binding protein